MLPNKKNLYYNGGRLEAAVHARLQIGNSTLTNDLHSGLHVIDSPLCPCDLGDKEDAKHFVLKCEMFSQQRIHLINDLKPLIVDDSRLC